MEFSFTDEQQMIRDTAEGFLAEVSTSEAVRAGMATELGYDPQLWQRVCSEMFWQAIHIPEEYGGMGLGYVELVAMLEQMGRHLFCSPFYSTVCLGVNALLIAGSETQKSEYLPRIVEGKTATLAYTGAKGRWDAAGVELACTETGSGYALNGICRYVPDGHSADLLVVAARAPGSEGEEGISLFILPADADGVSRVWLPTMDQTRKQAEIRFDQVQVALEQRLGGAGDAWPQLATIIDLATVAIASDQVGGAQQALDSTVEYLKERVQFGRTIASYQAVKHKCADMMLKVEAARSGLYYAACIADEALSESPLGAELPEAASLAKAYCSDAYFFNAGCGIQLHGGVGFTEEYDIQLYFKRAKSTETFLGDGTYHRERIARLVLDGEAAA
ncbi:MAG: acyl-CoA dehydrogenase family protein [Pseudomonadota bacterium]